MATPPAIHEWERSIAACLYLKGLINRAYSPYNEE